MSKTTYTGGTSQTGTWEVNKKASTGVVVYPSKLDLLKYDVFYEDVQKDIFVLKGIPEYFTFGKHTIFLGYRDTIESMGYGLRVGSDILMEVTDSVGNIIFSELISNKVSSTTMTDSGFGAAYIRIDRNPDRTFDFINDGIGHITLLGELDGNIPNEWKGHYNCRFTQEIEIRKDLPNRSSLYFEDFPSIQVTTTTADESTVGKRAGLPSVLKVYNHMQFDNLQTVGGKIDFIEANFRSDANDLSGSNPTTLIDTFKVSPVELLTVSGNLYHKDTTWVGQFIDKAQWDSSGIRQVTFKDTWNNSYSGISHYTLTDESGGTGPVGGLPGSHAINAFYGNFRGFPHTNNNMYIAKYFRTTTAEEKLTVRYNISGSGGVIIKGSYSSSADLDPGSEGWTQDHTWSDTGDGSGTHGNGGTGFIPEDTDNIVTLYSASFNDFNPNMMSGSIINGNVISSQSFNLGDTTNEEHKQIIQDDFVAPADMHLVLYLINNATSSAAQVSANSDHRPCYWNNISVKHQELDDESPPVYYRTLNINAGAQRTETHQYNARYLNSNREVAQDLNYSNQEITSSLSKLYTAEAMWIERGLGTGYEPANSRRIRVAGKFTNVTSGSGGVNSIYSSSVGVIGEATSDDQWDGFTEAYPSATELDQFSSTARGLTVGMYGLAIRPSQSSYPNAPFAIGVWGQAFDSGSDMDGPEDHIYSGYFNKGHFYVGSEFHLSSSFTQKLSPTGRFSIKNADDNRNLLFVTYSNSGAGYVGINTDDPKYKLDVNGNANFNGDITVDGDITANQYIVSSSVTYLTTSFASGSNVFGNTPDDTHQFTGSLYSSGSIYMADNTGSLPTISSSGEIYIPESRRLNFGADQNNNSFIRLSGTENAGDLEIHGDDEIIIDADDSIVFKKGGNPKAYIHGGSGYFNIGSTSWGFTPKELLNVEGNANIEGAISASGQISASSVIADGNLTSSFHSLFTETSITASGNISSSGDVKGATLTGVLQTGLSSAIQSGITQLGTISEDVILDSVNLQWVGAGDIITNVAALDWDLVDNNSSALSYDTTGKTGLLEFVTTNGSEKVKMSGDLDVAQTIIGQTITAQEISASHFITSSNIYLPNDDDKIIFQSADTYIYATKGGTANEKLYLGSDTSIILQPDSDVVIQYGTTEWSRFDGSSKRFEVEGSVTASKYTGSFVGDGSGLTNVSATVSPAGSDTHVQFNDGGSLAGESGFTYLKGTNSITAITNITASGDISASSFVNGNSIFESSQLYLVGNGDTIVVKPGTSGVADSQPYISSLGSLSILLDNANGGTDHYFNIKRDGALPSDSGGGSSTEIFRVDELGNITASGQISASKIIADGNLTSSLHSLYAETSITASGNISSSLTGSFGNVHIGDGLSGLGIGNGNDLLLYHDGNHSYIKDNGTGNLYYRGGTQTFQNAAGTKTMVVLNAANSVDLHYNDDKKFETAPLGINVTGRISATSHITASGNISASSVIADANLTSSFHSLYAETSITASGNISASGDIHADGIKATLPTGVDNSVVILDSDGFLKTDEVDGKVFDNVIGASGGGLFGGGKDLKYLYIDDGTINTTDAGNLSHTTTGAKLVGSLTASGQISASKVIADGNVTSSFHSLYTETSITASGNISSSGIGYFDDVIVNDDLTVTDQIEAKGMTLEGSTTNTKLTINNTGISSIDSVINFQKSSATNWTIGADGGDNNFKINAADTLGTGDPEFKIDGSGNTTILGNFTVGGKVTAVSGDVTSSFHSLFTEAAVTASGDISGSGRIYGKQREVTHHAYNNDSSTSALFIPGPHGYVIESSVVSYIRQWIAPYDGELIKVIINFENDPGATRLYLYLNGNPTHRKSITPSGAGVTTFDMTSTDVGARSTFDEGDILALTVDPTNAPGDVNLVLVWEYKIFEDI